MKTYRVRLIKYATYTVEAESEDDAINAACEEADSDPDAWIDDIDDVAILWARD